MKEITIQGLLCNQLSQKEINAIKQTLLLLNGFTYDEANTVLDQIRWFIKENAIINVIYGEDADLTAE